MYDNIGSKIKGLSVTVAVVTAIACIITGIVLMCSGDALFISGLLIAVIGSFSAWISSWLLYGFGELIEQTCNNTYYATQVLKIRDDVTMIRKALSESNERQETTAAEEQENQKSDKRTVNEQMHEQEKTAAEQDASKKQEQTGKKVKISELSYLKIDHEVEKKVYPANTFLENGWWKCGNCGTENAPYCNSCACGSPKKQITVK